MGSDAVSRPTPEQIAAADPAVSAWVGANAGSGKTRVLTQRVARLLLAGSAPERILCLTYTKAAAVEMRERLFQTLGGWAMAPAETLAAELAALEGAEAGPADPARLASARRLFAAALETPGGLKIQTIHAFCTEVLRRFPLEAGVSPRFEVIESHDRALMLAEIRREMAAAAEAGSDDAFDRIAARLSDDAADQLVEAVLAARARFETPLSEAALRQHFGAAAEGAGAVAQAALDSICWEKATPLAAWLDEGQGKTDMAAAAAIRAASRLAAQAPERPGEAVAALLGAFLTGKGDRRSRRGFPKKIVLENHPGADDAVECLLDWAEETRRALAAAEVADRARDLHDFAGALLAAYERHKAARGALDFADLVTRTARLLARAEDRAWVLYKLDAGIHHVLVDEAQDTAPEQWEVVKRLTAEFFAGAGAGPGGRTLFVVGDPKQSIYSFQGAEPAAFGATRAEIAGRAAGGLARPDLEVSFRSAPGLLAFVDRVFEGRAGDLAQGDPVVHRPSRAGDAARIDLWPLLASEEREEAPAEWWRPAVATPPLHAKQRLARLLAAELSGMIGRARRPARGGAPGAVLEAGDVIVLVRRRDALARELIRALKDRGVPVAGADRLTLSGSLAARDLLALAKAVLAPRDELSLAAVLRSPLCDLDDAALEALAAHRGERELLRDALARSPHTREAEMLADLRDAADYRRPYEFFERVLVRHDGRRRLVARLGPEAEDVIDELLEQALAYEGQSVPTLAGFVAWIEAGEDTIKREMEKAGNAVRVMTVHGAKGLEAPVVVLADTVAAKGGRGRPAIAEDPETGLALWLPSKDRDDAASARARAALEAREAAESARLLYVALTRAEDWLILCGAGLERLAAADWYAELAAAHGAMAEAVGGAERVALRAAGPGLPEGLEIARIETGPRAEAEDGAGPGCADGAAPPAPPAWAVPAPAEARPRRLSPSKLLAESEAGGGAGRGREAALAYGNAVHLLLERLADLPEAARAEAGHALLAAAPGLDSAAREAALQEALAVFAAPWAGPLFGPDSLAEAGAALRLPGVPGPAMIGRIDRLVVSETEALVLDYKTDRAPPARPEEVAPGYLAQLGAYRAALGEVFPGREIRAALLFSAEPRLMHLPGALLDEALAGAVAGLPRA